MSKTTTKRTNNKYTASAVLEAIGRLKAPVRWRALTDALDADSPREITQLRQMLKGLERNGELRRDLSGAYTLSGSESGLEGVVEGQGRSLSVGGNEIANAQRLYLRPGDWVSYRLEGDEAWVTDVIEMSDELVTGVLCWRGRAPYVEALGSLRANISLDEMPNQGSDGDTVLVEITGRERRGLTGVVAEVYEPVSVLDQAIESAVMAHQIPSAWPERVEAAASKLPKRVQPKRFPQRRDLRELPLVTIDGSTAKDFDDAVYAEPLSGRRRGWRLVVAIADVAHYVKPGSPLDDEAQLRGTSVYFPERVIPMLPEAISNGLCSLVPLEPRLSLVCDMEVGPSGQVKAHTFYDAVIFSHARLTYEQVQGYYDGSDSLDEVGEHRAAVTRSLGNLKKVYERLRSAREARGALDFATREGALKVTDGRIERIAPVRRLMTHQLIEEAMVAANVCAAEFLERNDRTSLYRVHEPPDATKLEALRQALAYAGVRLPKGASTPTDIQGALDRLPKTANQWLYGQLALRSMQQAVYTPSNKGHFGLALKKYMHFTSPIRRYPDLMVHRAIKAALGNEALARRIPEGDELDLMGQQCSSHERRAESAGWMVDGWLKCDYMQRFIGETLDGTIATVTDFGLFVELEGYYVQGLVHVANLGSDFYHYNAAGSSLVGERSGRRFIMGDAIRVVIQDIDVPQGKIDLVPAGQGKDGGKGGRGRDKVDKSRVDQGRVDKSRADKNRGGKKGRRRGKSRR